MKQFFIILSSIFLFFLTSASYSYWPGKWSLLDDYIQANVKKTPKYLIAKMTRSSALRSNFQYDAKNRILSEKYYREDHCLGESKYEYKNDKLTKILHYNADKNLLDTMYYYYKNNKHLYKIIIKKKNGKIDRTMKIFYRQGKITKTEVYDFLKRKQVITKFIYEKTKEKKNRLKEILYFIPRETRERKKIKFTYTKDKLVSRLKIENGMALKNSLEYKKNRLSRILYYDQFKRKVKEKIIHY